MLKYRVTKELFAIRKKLVKSYFFASDWGVAGSPNYFDEYSKENLYKPGL